MLKALRNVFIGLVIVWIVFVASTRIHSAIFGVAALGGIIYAIYALAVVRGTYIAQLKSLEVTRIDEAPDFLITIPAMGLRAANRLLEKKSKAGFALNFTKKRIKIGMRRYSATTGHPDENGTLVINEWLVKNGNNNYRSYDDDGHVVV